MGKSGGQSITFLAHLGDKEQRIADFTFFLVGKKVGVANSGQRKARVSPRGHMTSRGQPSLSSRGHVSGATLYHQAGWPREAAPAPRLSAESSWWLKQNPSALFVTEGSRPVFPAFCPVEPELSTWVTTDSTCPYRSSLILATHSFFFFGTGLSPSIKMQCY